MQAYDQHLNMVLSDVIETVTTVEQDDETLEQIVKVRHSPTLTKMNCDSLYCSL